MNPELTEAVQDIKTHVDARIDQVKADLDGRVDAAEERLKGWVQSAIHDSETRLLREFHEYAEGIEARPDGVERGVRESPGQRVLNRPAVGGN